jgi:hypothetical protein
VLLGPLVGVLNRWSAAVTWAEVRFGLQTRLGRRLEPPPPDAISLEASTDSCGLAVEEVRETGVRSVVRT